MTQAEPSSEEIRRTVRETYAAVARRDETPCCGGDTPSRCDADTSSCCGGATSSCCAEPQRRATHAAEPVASAESARSDACCATPDPCCSAATPAASYAERLGYSPEQIGSVPEGANMGLGCGNPQAIASLQAGEVVLDLGSGGGLDCFLAAQQVGEMGRVIGVDMTPEMISKAREHASRGGYANVEFRLGEIEHLPVADQSVDVILSNCVINISPDKPAVFREAYRALRAGGRLAISDVVATAPIPDELRSDARLWSGCLAGAQYIGDLEETLKDAGFQEIRITPKDSSRDLIKEWAPGSSLTDYVVSAMIEGRKPH